MSVGVRLRAVGSRSGGELQQSAAGCVEEAMYLPASTHPLIIPPGELKGSRTGTPALLHLSASDCTDIFFWVLFHFGSFRARDGMLTSCCDVSTEFAAF